MVAFIISMKYKVKHVSHSVYFSLPYELGNMSKLKSLIVDGNPMRSIRRDIIAVSRMYRYRAIESCLL